ncbi:hypothetical protein HX099_10775 [Thiopseudomonas alkaliphila]|uniref:Uncharacterized protein n=1 Tax=Thiopseudomonas alkaliphila TaxID=1697053 RepID=A0AAW7DWP8_9GAMM|nr:hypothetical protein [Thiopseudomonas alkaliphila]MDM1697136.1 hypothetical protein [Thiopseudomonas alkaliphila]
MQNLNSDKLRRQLDENNAAMNKLAEDNQKIVELLASRGLQAINYSSDLAEIRLLLERRADVPLTTGEVKAGGWWCAEAGKEVEQELARRNVIIISKKWRQKTHIYGCMSVHPRIASQFVEPEWAARLRQIHRIGSEFYWGAP